MTALVLVFFVLYSVNPAGAFVIRGALAQELPATPEVPQEASSPEQSFYDLFAEAMVLQQQEKFAEAAAVLETIIQANEGSDEVTREALNRLVYNHMEWNDGSVEEVGTRALRRYPDLQADTIYIPPKVNDLYDGLRARLFGSLTIKKPEGCHVFLNGELVGETPFFQEYLEVAEYELLVTRVRRHAFVDTIQVDYAINNRNADFQHSLPYDLLPLRLAVQFVG